jgi:hypothetical protein
MENFSPFRGKLQDTLVWWLGKKRSFNINDEYEIKLLFIDKVNNSAKIEITNLRSKTVETMEVSNEQ